MIKPRIVIAGGGVVGSLAALSLAQTGQYTISVIEAMANPDQPEHPSFDDRMVALSSSSCDWLLQQGVALAELFTAPIQNIHVSDKGHIGQTRLSSQNKKPLGRVVSLRQLGHYLVAACQAQSDIDYLQDTRITHIERHEKHVSINTNQHELDAALLIIAEGANSSTRELCGIATNDQDYAQVALIANVQSQLKHQSCAFERFTDSGPFALLPMIVDPKNDEGRHLSLVYCVSKANAPNFMQLSDSDFLARIQSIFGDRLGRFEALSSRSHYPLMLKHTTEHFVHRSLCIGNAAQSLHPIAGQGLNLAIRDIAALHHTLCSQDPGTFESIQAYTDARAQDRSTVISATDTLVRLFSNQDPLLTRARNLGLVALNKCAWAKHYFARSAMGYR